MTVNEVMNLNPTAQRRLFVARRVPQTQVIKPETLSHVHMKQKRPCEFPSCIWHTLTDKPQPDSSPKSVVQTGYVVMSISKSQRPAAWFCPKLHLPYDLVLSIPQSTAHWPLVPLCVQLIPINSYIYWDVTLSSLNQPAALTNIIWSNWSQFITGCLRETSQW